MPNNPSTVNATQILLIRKTISKILLLKWINTGIGTIRSIKIVVFFSTQWNPGLIVWMIYNFWLCVWTKNYLANSFDQVGTVIRTREKWKIQFGADDKSNLKFMFQSEGDHNMSSFEADLKKQILGRWEYLRKWFLSTSQS